MKRKKTLLISAGIALSCLCAGFIAVGNMTEDNTFVMNADKVYTMNLGKDNGFTNENYSLSTQTKTYGLVTLNGFLAKANANGFAKLASNGAIYNYSASGYGSRVTSIKAIKATFSGGALKMRVSRDLSGKIFTDAVSLTSGEEVNVSVVSPYYFILEAGDQEVDITSLEISYACADRDVLSLYQLGKVYTGEKDGVVYKAVINGASSTIDTLNKATNDHYNCSVAVDGEQIKFTIDGAGSLYFNPNEGRNKLTIDSSKGIGAMFAGLSFDEVFTVDNFENMVQGSGYDDVTKSFTTMTGLRAKFLSDFNNSETSRTTSPLGWKLMGSSDYLTLASGTGRNGTNAAVFKVSNSSGLRYVTMSSLYNIPRTMGKGSTFSFWAHGPVTSAGAAASKDAKIKVRLFFKNPITGVNDTNGEATELTVSAGTDWTHYELPLNSSKEYYGYCIYSSSASQYLPIDDIEIYTANPYAEYVAPVAVTGVSVAPTEVNLVVGGSSKLTATVAPDDATNKNVTWASNNASVTVDADGTVHGVSVGSATVTATTEDGGFTATCAVTVSVPADAYPEGSFKGTATIGDGNFDIVIAIGNQTNGLVAVRLSNLDAKATGISYNGETKEFSITTTGSYSHPLAGDLTYGTISGKYDAENNKLINVSCSGTIGTYVSNNGNIEGTRLTNMWDCDQTTAELQNMFKRRYMDGGWQVDNSNADRITSNTEQFVSGTGSMKRRGTNGKEVALNFKNDFSPAKVVTNVQFWVYNPSANNITLRMWYYKSTGLKDNGETGSVVAVAGQWTYVAMGFGQQTIYNFQIADMNKTGVYLSFDNITLF